MCKESTISPTLLENSGINDVLYTDSFLDTNSMKGDNSVPCEISDLANLELDTPPDFQLVSLPSSTSVHVLGIVT